MKPINMKTWEARAILGGRKTVTRLVVKPQPHSIYYDGCLQFCCKSLDEDSLCVLLAADSNGNAMDIVPPYQSGDILYVREAWLTMPTLSIDKSSAYEYLYKADMVHPEDYIWRPSIHMPREAARIFLRVTDVGVKRLQDSDDDEALKEGYGWFAGVDWAKEPFQDFRDTWDSTIKPKDRARYGLEANPWCWVIEFERCEMMEIKSHS